MHRSPRLLLVSVALALAPAPTAHARAGDRPLEERRFQANVWASDEVRWEVREGDAGDRCQRSTSVDGRAVTTARTREPLRLSFLRLPRVGVVLRAGVALPRVTSELSVRGRVQPGFPCGCGPSSELGPCPAGDTSRPVAGTCERPGRAAMTVGSIDVRARGIARWELTASGCPDPVRTYAATPLTPPAEVPLTQRDLGPVLALHPGGSTRVLVHQRHVGPIASRCQGDPEATTHVCGEYELRMTVERVR